MGTWGLFALIILCSTGLSHALLVLLSHLTNTQTETPFNPASLISRPHPPSCAVSACCYRLPTTRIYPILDLPRGSLRSRDPSSHKLSHQITLQKSVTPPANQRQDDEAQGTTQKKKKVTAAQLRVQKDLSEVSLGS